MPRHGDADAPRPDVLGDTVVGRSELQARVSELAAEISARLRGQDLLLIGVLKGAVFFLADLMRTLDVPCELDFMAVSSYGSLTESSGVVRILKDLERRSRAATSSSSRTSSTRGSRSAICCAT